MLICNSLGVYVKSLEVLLISAVKFIVAAPVSYLNGFGYLQTLIITAIGGVGGVVFFYYAGGWFFSSGRFSGYDKKNKSRISIFGKKIAIIEKIRKKYGLAGIIILTPVLLSIPLGTLIANKYYSSRKMTPLYLTLSVICWSFIMTTLFNFLR